MKEVHAHMTGLEARFEDEMHKLPGWKDELEGLKGEHHESKPKKASKKEKAIEESMVLGR